MKLKILFLWLLCFVAICLRTDAQVVVSGPITNNGGVFPAVAVNQVQGAPQIVADMTALSNSPSWLRADGQLFHVLSPASNWRLVGGTDNASWTEIVGDGGGTNYVVSTNGTISGQQTFTNIIQWIVNPVDNTGLVGGRFGSGVLWMTSDGHAIYGYTSNSFIVYNTADFRGAMNGDGGGLTNLSGGNGLNFLTNAWAGPTNPIDLRLQDQYYDTVTPVSITGFANKSNTVAQSLVLTLRNLSATNVTLYLPPGVRAVNAAVSYTLTNAQDFILSLKYSPSGPRTNAISQRFF